MKKLILLLLLLAALAANIVWAQGDFYDYLPGWDYYYYFFEISGYPSYNKLFDRYDFYDIDDNYCGSLRYNSLLEEWEYFSL